MGVVNHPLSVINKVNCPIRFLLDKMRWPIQNNLGQLLYILSSIWVLHTPILICFVTFFASSQDFEARMMKNETKISFYKAYSQTLVDTNMLHASQKTGKKRFHMQNL